VITKLFSPGVTAEALRAIIDIKSSFAKERDKFGRKFQVQGVVRQKSFFLSEKENGHMV